MLSEFAVVALSGGDPMSDAHNVRALTTNIFKIASN